MGEPGAADPVASAIDTLLGGRLRVRQSRSGHRAGTDAVVLAACAAVRPGDRFVDVGAGVGTVGLALALRVPDATGVLLDIDAATIAVASGNCALNGLADRVSAVAADLFDAGARRAAGLAPESATLVVSNPPFYRAGEVRASADAARARAHVLGGTADHGGDP